MIEKKILHLKQCFLKKLQEKAFQTTADTNYCRCSNHYDNTNSSSNYSHLEVISVKRMYFVKLLLFQ